MLPDGDEPVNDTEEESIIVQDGHKALSEEHPVEKNQVSNEPELNITDLVVRYLQRLRLEDDIKSEELIF